MNPELPSVRPSHEAMPQIPGSAEYLPDGTMRTPEVLNPSPERAPSQQETAPQPVPLPVIPADQVALPQVMRPAAPATDDSTTVTPTAADDDVIEQEWVDRAKKIITITKGNPYEQAKAIAALQADYLKKRYNKTIGEIGE